MAGMNLSMLLQPDMDYITDKQMVFITGAPRSGTSLLTKVLDAHGDIALLMENNFDNRRRHWQKAREWQSPAAFRKKICKAYKHIKEPIIGNKVCTPDVWWAEDILQFCRLFKKFRIIFIVRDPRDVVRSRFFREDYLAEFNDLARRHIMLDFRTRFLTYTSSWRQSIEVYRQLRDAIYPDILCVYYEDLINQFDKECRRLTDFLSIEPDTRMQQWHELPHHDSGGSLQKDVKYRDLSVTDYPKSNNTIPEPFVEEYEQAIDSIRNELELWKLRRIQD